MYKKLFTSTTFFIIIALVLTKVFLIFHSENGNLYGINNHDDWLRLLIFNPSDLVAGYGISLLLSFFFHPTMNHFILNLVLFFTVGLLVENKLGRLKTIVLIFALHLLSLFTLWGIHLHSESRAVVIYSGASAAILGMLSFFFILKRKWISLAALLGILVFNAITTINPLVDPHFIGLLWGSFIGFVYSKFVKVSSSLT